MEVSRGVVTRFDVGSYVLISYNPQKMNAKPLHPQLKGPYLVANVQGDKYSCQNLVTDEIEDYHVTRLREFSYDERYVDPRDIALRDREEFFVEKILAHRGDVGRLKTLTFHVKWRGFDESFNSWEPWKNLRETEMLHRYLILHGLQKLIPAKFREKYSELAVGRRRRRPEGAAEEEQQQVRCSGTGKFTVVVGDLGREAIEDPQEIPQPHDPIFKTINNQDYSRARFLKATFVNIFMLCVCFCHFVHYLEVRQDARVDPWLM